MAHAPDRLLGRLLPRPRQSFWLRRVLIFVLAVVVVDALFGDRGLAQTIRARQEYGKAAAALSVLKRENAGLREEARRLAEDPATIESIAREELGLIHPGEVLVVLKLVR